MNNNSLAAIEACAGKMTAFHRRRLWLLAWGCVGAVYALERRRMN